MQYGSPVRAPWILSWTWILCALQFAIGCGPIVDADASCDSTSDRIELGSGGARLVPLPETGGELTIVHGAQGGIHVLVGCWVRDIDLSMDLTYRLEDAVDGAPVGEPTTLRLRAALFRPAGGRNERGPDLIILNNEAAPVELYRDREVIAVAEARSDDGSFVCDRRRVRIVE